jgi:hypothetical protein
VGRSPSARRTAATIAVLGSIVVTAPAAAVPPGHTVVVASVPSTLTPDIVDGSVEAIYDAGSKVIAVGGFANVQNRNSDTNIARRNVVAFSKATGLVDNAFAPTVDGVVNAVIAGPTAGTVYLAGGFTTVNGTQRRKVALLNVSDGSLVTAFAGPAIGGQVNDVVLAGSRILLGGTFTTVGGQTRNGLASLNASTGALDSYLTVAVTGHHNYNGSGANGAVGPKKLAISPNGTQLVVIGNFKNANAVLHDQVVKLDLGTASATIANWNTDRYQPRCAANAFDSWIRDVAYSPDGSYFVIVSTGAPFPPTLCDTAARWEANDTGGNVPPTWVDWSGGDTLHSVTITEQAVYVGGHMRWMNNSLGHDGAQPGAVGRASIAALDPLSGVPLKWNPGRHPRGVGVTELYATPEGLWLGHDTIWMGNRQYRRERIAFLPVGGGYQPHSTVPPSLPGKVYQAGNVPGAGANDIRVRTYDGGTVAGPLTPVANPDATPWSNARGGFWVGGTLFYGANTNLYRRTFNGTAFGVPAPADPYHDPLWDTVVTGSGPTGQTYAGSTTNFYPEIPNVTGMFYFRGRLYYTLNGQNGLFWRWFSPDSGAVSPDKITVLGATGFADSGEMFVSGGFLYRVSRTTGTLSRMAFVNGAPSGPSTVVSGPALDGRDWRGRLVFVGP